MDYIGDFEFWWKYACGQRIVNNMGEDGWQYELVVFYDGGRDAIPAAGTVFQIRYVFNYLSVCGRIKKNVYSIICWDKLRGSRSSGGDIFVKHLTNIDEKVVKSLSYMNWVVNIISVNFESDIFLYWFFFVYDGFDDLPWFSKVALWLMKLILVIISLYVS